MKCHCDSELIPHTGGFKDGTFHCNKCGCCMEKDGKARAGHPGCGRFGIKREEPRRVLEPTVTTSTHDVFVEQPPTEPLMVSVTPEAKARRRGK